MGHNRPKRDRWPAHDPTRWVFIEHGLRFDRPWQGFVIDWRRHSYRWSALVTYIDDRQDGAPLVQKWFPVELLRPVEVDPNPPQDEWF